MWEHYLNTKRLTTVSQQTDLHLNNFGYPTIKRYLNRGFTLIELLIAVSIAAILAAVALPFFTDYLQRGKTAQALATLSQLAVQMESAYLDNRNYGDGTSCSVADQNDDYFDYACTSSDAQSFTWVATSGDDKYSYSIDQNSQHVTIKFAGNTITGSPGSDCWMISADSGGCY